ncbi:MAG: hypothetical protein E2O95_04100 [Acidobacteria bacterium]|nr:MAG: hypothetical protein E2O95_04100 [Acidobacteriota bacterium]
MFNRKHFDHRLDILELYLTVRDPGTAKSAEAYDGLRKALTSTNKVAQLHLAHVAQLHRAATTADSLEPVIAKLNEIMNQIGMSVVDDPTQTDLFEITDGAGTRLVVDAPAYLSVSDSGQRLVVSRGVAHGESPPVGEAKAITPEGVSLETEPEEVAVEDRGEDRK